MKTYNIKYLNENELKEFVLSNNLKKYNNILIQVFTGNPGKRYILLLQEILKELLPQAIIIGATTDGEIIGQKVLTKNTVISISVFQNTSLKSILIEHKNKNSYETGKKIAENILSDNTKAVILFSDGINTNADELLKGFEEKNGKVLLTGGMAGDNGLLKQTFVFNEDKITDSGAVAVALNSDSLQAASTFKYDWLPIGKEFTVTKSDKNRVYTIDNIPAYELYKKYLGEDLAKKLPAVGIEFPLVIKKGDNLIARACIKDPKDGSLIFAGNIKEGEIVQFAYGNIETILQTSDSFANFLENHPCESIFIYSCMARRRFLKSSAPLELKPLKDLTNSISGFFTYGEFYTTKRHYELLNETMTILMLSENEKKNKKIIHKNGWSKLSSHYDTLKALSHIAYVTSMELQHLNQTLEKKIKEEVEKSRKKDRLLMQQTRLAQMGEMINMIAHQWKQPLNAISATASGLRLRNSLGKYDQKFFDEQLGKIEEYTKHMANTIEDFRNFFKPTKKMEEVSLENLIDNALTIMNFSLNNNNIKIVKIYQNPTKIKTFANEIKHVILNIIKNAEDALVERNIEDKYIKIKTYKKEKYHIIEIEDNAKGIDEKIIDRIFDPYFSTKKKKGTGIGLYMSKIIVEEHCRGELEAQNTPQGALFRISLPEIF